MAIGLNDPASPIRVKILHHGKPTPIDADFWRGRVDAAMAIRAGLLAGGDTTGVRCVNGENDGFPGLVVDRYADVLVVKLYTAAWFAHLATLVARARRHAAAEGDRAALGPHPARRGDGGRARRGDGALRRGPGRTGDVLRARPARRGRRRPWPEDGLLPRPARQPRPRRLDGRRGPRPRRVRQHRGVRAARRGRRGDERAQRRRQRAHARRRRRATWLTTGASLPSRPAPTRARSATRSR